MTVVSYLCLDEKSGMGCADTRELHGGRAYDIATKICQIPGGMLSYAGAVPYGEEMVLRLRELSKQEPLKSEPFNIVQTAETVYHNVRNEVYTKTVLNRYGVSWGDLKKGDIDSQVKEKIVQLLENPNAFGVNLILGVQDKNREFRVYTVEYPGVAISYRGYATIGSGMDRADLILGDSLHNMSFDERRRIDKWKGARILLEATQAAWRNIGVGGYSQLVLVDDGNFKEYGLVDVAFLHNVLYLEHNGVFEKRDSEKIFKRVIDDNARADEMIPELREKIGLEKLVEIFFKKSLHL